MMNDLLTSAPSWLNFGIYFMIAAALLGVVLGFVTFGVLSERKVLGFMQLRVGPNRLGGPWGLLQTVADVLKLLLKEDVIPKKADKPLFILAPVIAFVPAFVILAVIPFSENLYFTDMGVGLLFYIAISGITTMGVVAGSWASNNKYALIGGMRAAAQMISYEVPLVLSVVGVVLLTGSLNLITIVEAQTAIWFIVPQILGFLVFLIASIAELNRVPFDLPEGESEIVAGYHVEYSGFRYAFFMLAEYVYMFAMASLTTVLFLGGWQPLFGLGFIPGIVWFALKFSVVFYFMVWLRGTMPRLPADKLMGFAWKVLLPIAIINIILTALVKEFIL
ncbi:NADH-quinone oxidoreductase subunit NuoH [Desertibacillus haloalkaliphilus]|uniref:NADH-quinone oxidoreductase subunit NuoH n=1 Tax=Desertibacillus haloalkaliphilus TaxID=1328930 RepID=UPI001C2708A7|nr:NADH-quinone oxidoreductase subunit NuoH [Desertibacillus haloalkaliphilus]MBU8905896.1 NADH-quinone oxidoreductase subunit NuoH [Desertibacillus haloalkaliphilus]